MLQTIFETLLAYSSSLLYIQNKKRTVFTMPANRGGDSHHIKTCACEIPEKQKENSRGIAHKRQAALYSGWLFTYPDEFCDMCLSTARQPSHYDYNLKNRSC